jgi:hypothetical protein
MPVCARASVAEGRDRKGTCASGRRHGPRYFSLSPSVRCVTRAAQQMRQHRLAQPFLSVGRSAAIIDSGPEFVSRSDLIHPNGVTTHTPAPFTVQAAAVVWVV